MASKVPLTVSHPDLAREADGWDPENYSAGSSKKMFWRCSRNHSFQAFIYSRAIRGDKCPICSGKRVQKGFNDLTTTHPALASQALDWDPSKYSAGSNKMLSWKCKYGHIWKSNILNRAKGGTGCPICSNTKIQKGINDLATTHPEVANKADGWDPSEYSYGSSKRVNWKCKFGHSWTGSIQSQARKNGCPVCSNHKIVSGVNDFATTHPNFVEEVYEWDPKTLGVGSDKKVKWKCKFNHVWEVSPESRFSKLGVSGCPVCSNKKLETGFNDLLTTHAGVASQALGWDPSLVIAGSNRKREWICNSGHTWLASPEQRTGSRKSGCPYCSNKKLLVGFNDLATRFPEIAEQADGWDPTTIITGHAKKRWKCSKGHKWIAEVVSRTSTKTGCPSCASYGFSPSEKGYLYFLEHDLWKMLQIGITNYPEDRLKDHKKLGWTVVDVRGPMDGLLAQNWETSILRMLREKGADLSNKQIAGKFDGYSEAWSKGKFKATSIKELMSMAEEFERLKSTKDE